MYVRLVLCLLPLLGQWKGAEADCARVGYSALCQLFPGVHYDACTQDLSNGGSEITSTATTCGPDVDNVFSANPQEFNAARDVRIFVITELSIPEGVQVTIDHLSCSMSCSIMTLTSEAEAPLVFRTNSATFNIRASGPGVTLKFQCNYPDRQCTKMPNNGMMYNPKGRKRMVNGVVAAPHEFPFSARMMVFYSKYNSPDGYASCNSDGFVSMEHTQANCANGREIKTMDCGGSIIHENWILTSSHCYKPKRIIDRERNYRLMGVLVTVGDHLRTGADPNRETRWVPPQRIHTHTQFQKPSFMNNNIGFLKVIPSINLDENYRYPICLPPSYMINLDLVGSKVTSVGSGMTETGKNSIELRKGDFEVITNEECNKIFHSTYNIPITEQMLCTLNNVPHPCYGDGGSATFCTAADYFYYEVGILSFASTSETSLCQVDEPSSNTRVTKYLEMIKNVIAPDVLP